MGVDAAFLDVRKAALQGVQRVRVGKNVNGFQDLFQVLDVDDGKCLLVMSTDVNDRMVLQALVQRIELLSRFRYFQIKRLDHLNRLLQRFFL